MMVACGVRSERTTGRFSAGVAADLAQGVRFNLGYTGEFAGKARHNVTGGLSISF